MSFQAMTWAVEQELPVKQKIVLLMLANRTNHDTGRCDPSHKRLAKECGMSISSVKRAIAELEAAGYLTVENRRIGDVNLPNQYVLNLNRVGSHRTEVGSHRPEGVGSHRPTNQESNNQEYNQEEEVTVRAPRKKKATERPVFNWETGKIEGIPAAAIAKWREAYPGINVDMEIAKAEAWQIANPNNRKSNYVRFLNGWMSRAQDRAPRAGGGGPLPQRPGRPAPRHTGLSAPDPSQFTPDPDDPTGMSYLL